MGGAAVADDMSLANVGIYTKSGDLVSSVEDVDFATTGTPVVVEFSDVIFASEDDAVDYVIKADINENAVNASTYQVTNLGDGTKTFFDIDVDSNENILDNTTQVALTPVKTVKGAAMKLAILGTLDDQTVKSNKEMAEVAVIQLDAVASGKDIDVDVLSLDFAVTGTGALTDIDSCEIFDGTTSVSNKVNIGAGSAEDFNLSGVTVTAGTIKALSVKCDIGNNFVAGDKIDVTLNTTITNHDVKDGSEDVTPTLGANTSAQIVITAASLVDTLDAEPADVAAMTGATVELGTVKLDPTDVDGVVTKLPLTVVGDVYLAADRKVEVYAGSTHVADAYFSATSIIVDS